MSSTSLKNITNILYYQIKDYTYERIYVGNTHSSRLEYFKNKGGTQMIWFLFFSYSVFSTEIYI